MVANRIEGDGELINDGHSMGGVSCENGFQGYSNTQPSFFCAQSIQLMQTKFLVRSNVV